MNRRERRLEPALARGDLESFLRKEFRLLNRVHPCTISMQLTYCIQALSHIYRLYVLKYAHPHQRDTDGTPWLPTSEVTSSKPEPNASN